MRQKSQIPNLFQKSLNAFLLLKLATAYLEPGSSSFLLKILVSSLVAFVVFFRQIWSYVQAVLGRLSGKQTESTEEDTAVPNQPSQNEIQ